MIKRELTVTAALSGVNLGGSINSRARPFESLRYSGSTANRQASPLSGDRSFLYAGPTSFPVPPLALGHIRELKCYRLTF